MPLELHSTSGALTSARAAKSSSTSRRASASDRDGWERMRYVLCHPLHLSIGTTLLATTLLVGSAWMLIALAVLETITLGVLPRSNAVARRAQRHRREHRRLVAAQARVAMHPSMEPMHVQELAELERRISTARSHAASVSESVEILFDEWLAPDRLLDGYVRLSVAHRTARESSMLADAAQLHAEIAALELERDTARSSRLRRLAERRIELTRRRLTCLREAEEERDALASEIASVAALCRLVQERTTAVVGQGDLHAEIERLVGDVELCDDAMSEVHATATARAAEPMLVRVAEEITALQAQPPMLADVARGEPRSGTESAELEVEPTPAHARRRMHVG
ncbi:hypothetical protein DB32_005238 [Sandaracinus amylolyticus]|uniref:Uncharacterized protein n=2 Tax=Sandaracinus amylolyticus TaxID=927083 RepID=A0A0F6SG52_9BACT|nr:hypothetical protein DB32_005238 [Sandaracinus amylolyticus]